MNKIVSLFGSGKNNDYDMEEFVNEFDASLARNLKQDFLFK